MKHWALCDDFSALNKLFLYRLKFRDGAKINKWLEQSIFKKNTLNFCTTNIFNFKKNNLKQNENGAFGLFLSNIFYFQQKYQNMLIMTRIEDF